MPRFSIRQLLITTAVAAVGCFALLNASQIWAATLLSGVGVILAASILLAVFRDGERRAYWIGFATFGWLYLLLCFGGIFRDVASPFGWRENLAAQLTGVVYDQLYGSVPPRPIPVNDPFAPADPFAEPQATMQRPLSPNAAIFVLTAHALWTLLLAVSGGWFAHWLYVTRQKV